MRKFYSLTLSLLSFFCIDITYSQGVGAPNSPIYLDDDNSGSNCVAIGSSFLNVSHNNKYVYIKIPILIDDNGNDNDYMNKCLLKYKFYNNSNGISNGNISSANPNKPILEIRKNNSGFKAGGTGSQITCSTNQGNKYFYYKTMLADPNNNNTGADGLDGEITYEGIQEIVSDSDGYRWSLAKFKWAVPAWAYEDYAKLDLLLHIDFEDYGSGRMEFDNDWHACYSENMTGVSSSSSSRYDLDCQGPEWEIKTINTWKPTVQQNVTKTPTITNSDYQVTVNGNNIGDPITSNNDNAFSYLKEGSTRYFFANSKDPFTSRNASLPSAISNLSSDTHDKWTDMDKAFTVTVEPGQSKNYKIIYYENGWTYGLKRCTLNVDFTAQNLKAPSSFTVTKSGAQHVALSWSKNTDRPNSHVQYQISRKCLDGPGCNSTWNDNYKVVSGGTTSWTDHDVVPGNRYDYRIRTTRLTSLATNSSGSNYYSSWVDATSVTLDNLPAVSNLTETIEVITEPNGDGGLDKTVTEKKVKLDWSDVTKAGFNTIRYQIYKNGNLLLDNHVASSYEDNINTEELCNGINWEIKTKAKNIDSGVNHIGVNSKQISSQLTTPDEVISFIGSSEEEGIQLTWNQLYTNPNVDYFSIWRDAQLVYEDIPNSNSYFNFNANDSYQTFIDTDNELEDCTTYEYQIRTSSCGLFTNSQVLDVLRSVELDLTFTPSKNLNTTTGFYEDKVKLDWQNNFNDAVNQFIIKRRVYKETNPDEWSIIDQVDNSQHAYVDLYTDASKLYEYQVAAQIPCGDYTSEVMSNPMIGFRYATASVTGHIDYEGAMPVENIKVVVNPTESLEATNYSIKFNGNNSFISMNGLEDQLINKSFSFSTWLQFSNLSNGSIFSINDDSESNFQNKFSFYIDQSDLKIMNQSGNSYNIELEEDFVLDEWYNLTFTYDINSSTLKVYVDADLIYSDNFQINVDQGDLISIGQRYNGSSISDLFSGAMDEIRIYDEAIDELHLKETYNSYIAKTTDDLIVYFPCNEGGGNNLYDISKNENTFNKNHATLLGNHSFDSNVPNEIGNFAYTDENGNYIIEGIRYSETGNNFVITPTTVEPYYFSPHQFSPSQRVVYLGDQANITDGQNFTDISSFKFTGYVYYHDLHDYNNNSNFTETSNFPVEDVIVKIDGEPVITNGDVVTSDSEGKFIVDVPIGNHRISVEKNGHTFQDAHYPGVDSVHNFQDDKSGIHFTDNTIVKIMGRSVGGDIEAAKKLGMGLSNNNIGSASITFQSDKYSSHFSTITTEASSGEYSLNLLPEKYLISNFEMSSPASLIPDIYSSDYIDCSTVPILTSVSDTTFLADGTYSNIDSASYHFEKSFIYYAPPSIRVLNKNKDSEFTAEESIMIDESTSIDITNYSLPVFKQSNLYESYIKVEEKYINYDLTEEIIDLVPVKTGQISIINNISTNPLEQTILLDSEDGDTLYSFRAGSPNISTSYEGKSFSKDWQITYESGSHNGNNIISWEPNGEYYSGIIFGSKPEGSNFITEGPQVVSHILRDPPGSGSFAFYESGTSVARSTEYSTSYGSEYGMDANISLGPDFSVGLGYEIDIELIYDVGYSVNSSAAIGYDNEYIDITTYNSSFETSDDNVYQGSMMDIYMGRSMNMNFGMSTNLTLIDTATCNLGLKTIDCPEDEEINGYKIGKRKGFFAVPGGYGTEFYYTQYDIILNLIPELKLLRDNQLLNDPRYINNVSSNETHLYGSNNDDDVWGTLASSDENLKSILNDGPSYTFTSSADTAQVDSVRWFNQQIKLWENAIAENERLKLSASPVQNGPSNISFDGGVGEITNIYENTSSESKIETWETAISEELAIEIGAKVMDVGGSLETSIEFTMEQSGAHSFTEEFTTTVGYTLADGDLNDKYSINIKDDGTAQNGKVFSVEGGRTSCPYQGQEVTLYHNPGTELSAATVQMEQPVISISPNSLANVPENEPAVFNLTLSNYNPLGYDIVYTLKVLEMTNPNGAIIKIDDLTPNREFMVPAGASINKVLTVEKGPEALEYNDIKLVFHSSCQYDPTDLSNSIYDEVTFSVSFLPGCTGVEISNPDPNWVVNTDNIIKSEDEDDGKSFLNVSLSGYNYNYYSLDEIKLEYRESNSSDWYKVESYSKNPSIISYNEYMSIPSDIDLYSSEYIIDSIFINELVDSNYVQVLSHYSVTQIDTNMKLIPTDQSHISVPWDVTNRPDGNYDIKATSDCNLASESSFIFPGKIDRVRPHSFGNPSPADGVLGSNDEIKISFNELINESLLSYSNFKISGILNGSELRNDASLYFNGSSQMNIPTGVNFKNNSFTIEMFVNAHQSGSLLNQGYHDGDQMDLSINNDGKLEFVISDQIITSNEVIEFNLWKHVCVIYDEEIASIKLLINGNEVETNHQGDFLVDYSGEGPIIIGDNFTGNIHEIRLWNEAKIPADIYANMYLSKSGKEANLIGLWQMNELHGHPMDKSRARHAYTNATWQVSPGGISYNFLNNDYLVSDMSDLSFRDDQDFTIELWFKANGPNQTIFSNGISQKNGWTVKTNSSGKIEVLNNSLKIEGFTDVIDNAWHHIAIVKNSTANTTLFVDGEEQGFLNSNFFNGFGGPQLVMGASVESDQNALIYSNYLNGNIDEFRIWEKARNLEQITRDAQSKLVGNENGLVAYYPFEVYELNQFNEYISSPTLTDQHLDYEVYGLHDLYGVTESFDEFDRPLIRRSRQVEDVGFDYSSNGNEIILSITDQLNKVEGCILDIEINSVYDLNNNLMSSPITWSAYINQNQLIWDEQEIEKNLIMGENLVFTTNIINQGGQIEEFNISNLPDWLLSNPNSGYLQPNSYQEITFTVNENLFIGNYNQDIILTGNNQYAERLELGINVKAEQPSVNINPNQFEYTMNFVGKLNVDEFRSRDDDDILFAYVGDELRGLTHPIYVPDFDAYVVFLSVYSNQIAGDEIEFRMWDASQGTIFSNVSINEEESIEFASDILIGSFDDLVEFNATNTIRQEIPLFNGWNWISFNLNSLEDSFHDDPTRLSIPTVFNDVNQSQITSFKSQDAYAQNFTFPDGTTSWFGSLSSLLVEDMYMISINIGDESGIVDTIVYDGIAIQPQDHPIDINQGWNWIGYLGQKSIDINSALSSMNSNSGDLIKSKTAFSIYASESLGWIGSLNSLNAGKGYMLKSLTSQTLIYPESSLYGSNDFRLEDNIYSTNYWEINPSKYEHSMSVVAKVNHKEGLNLTLNNILAAFHNGECVGNIHAIKINTQELLYFLTIYGNDNEIISFNYLDASNDVVYPVKNSINFYKNSILGSVDSPFEIEIDTEIENMDQNVSFIIYPNPFENIFEMDISLNEKSSVEVKLYDIMGRYIETIHHLDEQDGPFKLTIDGSHLEKGIYFVETIVNGLKYEQTIVKL